MNYYFPPPSRWQRFKNRLPKLPTGCGCLLVAAAIFLLLSFFRYIVVGFVMLLKVAAFVSLGLTALVATLWLFSNLPLVLAVLFGAIVYLPKVVVALLRYLVVKVLDLLAWVANLWSSGVFTVAELLETWLMSGIKAISKLARRVFRR